MNDTPNFPRLIDNDEGEITVTINGYEIRGWSYADRDEHILKMRMAREFCEGWHIGFGSALDHAREVFAVAMGDEPGKIISGDAAPSAAGTSRTDAT